MGKLMAWTIKSPSGIFMLYTMGTKKKTAIRAMADRWGRTWEQLYGQGYRAIKVTIEEVK